MWCRNHLSFCHTRASAGLNTEVCRGLHACIFSTLAGWGHHLIDSSQVCIAVLCITSYGSGMAEQLTGYIFQSSVWRGFWGFKPPSKPLGPSFYLTMSSMDPLYWPQPGWVQFQLWYLEVPGLLVTTLQFCLVQYLLQNKMSTCDMCSAWSSFNSRESGFAVTNENKITPKRTNILY